MNLIDISRKWQYNSIVSFYDTVKPSIQSFVFSAKKYETPFFTKGTNIIMKWETIWENISSVCIELAFKIISALLILVIGRALIRFVLKHFPKGTEKHPLDATARNFFISITKCALYMILIITIVSILGVPLASIITVVGSAGAAIALALQGSLSNLASGIMLLIFKPLKIGDYIEVDSASGTVSDLGIFYTTLITSDNRHITLPNSSLTNATITNYSRERTRRLELVFTADYSTDVEQAKQILLDTVRAHPYTLSNPVPFVRLTALDSSSINFTVRVWCLAENFWDLNCDLTEQIKEAFDENNISIPFPQLDVHVKQ